MVEPLAAARVAYIRMWGLTSTPPPSSRIPKKMVERMLCGDLTQRGYTMYQHHVLRSIYCELGGGGLFWQVISRVGGRKDLA